VKIDRVVEPDLAAKAVYEPYYEIYQSLYRSTKSEMHKLAELGQQ
jgi:sugar (pentulose or hexulose) kinase